MAAKLPAPARGSRRFGYRKPPVSDINVTPFVDVMLVLLIVFMVTAPMMTQGVQVALPQVTNDPIAEDTKPVNVTIKNNGKVFIQTREMKNDAILVQSLKDIQQARKGKTGILLRADKGVNYGRVMEVMGAMQQAGLVDVGMVTTPEK